MAKKKKKARRKASTRRASTAKRSTSSTPGKRSNVIVGVFGRRGTGKSYSIKRWVDAQPAARRIAVWDHNAEYAGPSSCDPIKGARVFHSMRDLLQYTLQRPCPSRIVLQAGRDEFPLFCRWALRAADPRVGHVIVLDEVNLYCSPHKASPELLEVMRIGRHSRVDVVFAARRFQEVHRDLTAQADQLRCFRTTEPRDLKVIADYCGADFAEALRLLPERGSSTWDGT